jgi:hypothetical protein
MGRLLLLVLAAGAAWVLVNHVGLSSLDPRGAGARVEGGQLVRDAGDFEARFSMVGSLDDAYMLFGGQMTHQRNSLTHAVVAGLAIDHARLISASYPDFHLCKSPGAPQAQRYTEDLSLVAADRAARNTLEEALELFQSRLRGGGDRTCIRVIGAPLVLDSVRLAQHDEDITQEVAPAFDRSNFVLAKGVVIEDCAALLR